MSCDTRTVALTILLCTDGSELAEAALARGLAVLGQPDRIVIATVMEAFDPMLVLGTGIAGGVMSPDQAQLHIDEQRALAEAHVESARAIVGRADAEAMVVSGPAGAGLCELAASIPADVIVMGTRGRGGLKRAVLGSVSDHVVRNAGCPVLTTGEA